MTMPVLAIQQNNGAALQEFFRAVLLDSENKVPSEALRIVGALSTGAVIESGDNANGEYIRFADGTQVCWLCNAEAIQHSTYINNRHIVWMFPAQFASAEIYVTGMALQFVAGYAYWPGLQLSLSESGTDILFCKINDAIVSGNLPVSLCAIGRWKE